MHSKPDDREPDDRFEFDGLVVERFGTQIVWTRGPDFDAARLSQRIRELGDPTGRRSREINDRLVQILASCAPLHLIHQVAILETTTVVGHDHQRRFGAEARLEHLCGLALRVAPSSSDHASPQQVWESQDLLYELFELRRYRILAEEIDTGVGDHDLAATRYQLRSENLSYRHHGYPHHLAQIIEALFERIRKESVDSLGFSPADVPSVAYALWNRNREVIEDQLDEAKSVGDQISPAPHPVELISWAVFEAAEQISQVKPEELTSLTQGNLVQARSLLNALTSPWGCQPAYEDLEGPNLFRRYPVLMGPQETYSVPLIWNLIQTLIPWFKDYVTSQGALELWAVYLDHRGKAVEEVICRTLSRIFGADRVHANVEYPIGGGNWAELDVLLDLFGHAIVFEAKSAAVHDATRRGEVEHIAYAVADLAEAPFQQAARAAKYLLDGGTQFRRRDGTGKYQRLDLRQFSTVTRVAVSLERLDPVAFWGARTTPDETAPTTWLVALADLLMVSDILTRPHEFAVYAEIRAEIASNARASVLDESSILGAFLADRMPQFLDMLDTESQMSTPVGYSDLIDDYFIRESVGDATAKPEMSYLRSEHAEELARQYAGASPHWFWNAYDALLARSDKEA